MLTYKVTVIAKCDNKRCGVVFDLAAPIVAERDMLCVALDRGRNAIENFGWQTHGHKLGDHTVLCPTCKKKCG